MDNSFTRESRLLKARQFQAVFENAELKASDKHFLFLATRSGENNARLGLVVGKKKVKLAVQRNRIKRVVREFFRHHNQSVHGLDIIFIARQGVGDLSNQALFERIDRSWQKLIRKHHQ